MKVFLIQAPYLDIYGPIKMSAGHYFPLGLGYIAAVLLRQGHEVRFIDPEVQMLDGQKLAELFRSE